MAEPGWFDVAGGKLTTYRRMGEQTVDEVARYWGRRLPKSTTGEAPLSPGKFSGVLPPAVCPAVIDECCTSEWAVHLDDVLLRRTSWHFYHPDQDRIAHLAAGWMAARQGWDDERQAAELQRYRDSVSLNPEPA